MYEKYLRRPRKEFKESLEMFLYTIRGEDVFLRGRRSLMFLIRFFVIPLTLLHLYYVLTLNEYSRAGGN